MVVAANRIRHLCARRRGGDPGVFVPGRARAADPGKARRVRTGPGTLRRSRRMAQHG